MGNLRLIPLDAYRLASPAAGLIKRIIKVSPKLPLFSRDMDVISDILHGDVALA
jgi:hypothetical protein